MTSILAGILGGVLDVAAFLGWAVVYALPWAGALVLGRWCWRRVRPLSALLAWATATVVALASLLVLSIVLVAAIEAVTLG